MEEEEVDQVIRGRLCGEMKGKRRRGMEGKGERREGSKGIKEQKNKGKRRAESKEENQLWREWMKGRKLKGGENVVNDRE